MKLQEFQKYLSEKEIDLVFLTHPDPNITYFTQMKPSHAFLLITPNSANFLITKLDHKPTIKEISTMYFPKKWKEALQDSKIKKVGINKNVITVSYFETLKKIYPKAKVIDISKKLQELRAQKSPEEIKLMSKACQITSQAFDTLINNFSKCKTELDVAFFLEKEMKSQGCDLAFPTIAATSKNAATPHHITSNQKLRRGFMILDFGACYKNYCADMSRTIFLGSPNKKEKSFYELLLNAQQQSSDVVAKGVSFQELDKIARKNLGAHAKSFIHSLGHGIGVEVHEPPIFSDKMQKIKINHTFTVEPGIYFPEKFGIRIEDTLAFDGKTCVLTTAPKNLIKLKI